MSPSTGDAYSDAFSPELARSWSAASQSLFCSSPRSVATPVPSEWSLLCAATQMLAKATRKLPRGRLPCREKVADYTLPPASHRMVGLM